MVKVILKSASNGVIKRVVDDNYNGAGEVFSLTQLYPIDDGMDGAAMQSHSLLQDLVDDLGIDLGSPTNREVLVMNVDWGADYVPTAQEVKKRISSIKAELSALRELLRNL